MTPRNRQTRRPGAFRSLGLPTVTTTWLVALALAASGEPALAQTVQPKRILPAAAPPLCPPVAPVEVIPSTRDREEADQLKAQASQVALVGDQARAIELLRQAESLNPASSEIAYLLGRALQEEGRGDEAAAYYCRYLAVAAGVEDGDEVRSIVADLLPPSEPLFDEAAGLRFLEGVEAWDGGEVAGAYQAFSDVVLMAPRLPEGHYNRGLVAAYQGQPGQAQQDLGRYLELRPDAQDAALVQEWIGHLRNPVYYRSPSGTLAAGLAIPGLGQFLTGSSRGGMSLLAVGAGAALVGLGYKTVSIRCLSLPENGVCPDGQVHSSTEDRDYLVPGLVAYGGATLLGAILAYRRAEQNNRTVEAAGRFRPVPGSGRGARLEGPGLDGGGRIGVRWLRLVF